MPLYECYCRHCDNVFEALLPLAAAEVRAHPCPDCGRRARRLLSAVTLGRDVRSAKPPEGAVSKSSDVTKLSVPPPAQICWMDKPSTARYAAYMHGRGAEYEETVAAKAESRRKEGIPADKKSSKPHSHSPLADPAVYARRRAAAVRSASKKSAPRV